MKKYSSNRAQKGKTAYRTPSRWLADRPEAIKRMPPPLKHLLTKQWSTKRSALRGGKGK